MTKLSTAKLTLGSTMLVAHRLELVSALPLAFTPELTMLLLMVSGRRRRTHKIETSLVHMSRTHSGGLTLHQPQDRLH